MGGRGSGKTRGGAVEILRMPANSNAMVIAPTNMMLRDGALRTLLELSRAAGIFVDYHTTHQELILLGNRRIYFRSGEHPDRIRGINVGFIWFDELCYCKPEVWPIAVATLREAPRKVIATTTPNGKDFVYDIFHRDSSKYAIVHSASSDNLFLDADYVKDLEENMTAEQFRQEGLGQFIDPIGADFNRMWFKYAERVPDDIQWYRYWDLAMTTKQTSDFTASAKLGMDSMGHLWLADIIQVKREYPEIKQLIIETMLSEPDTIVGIEEAVSGFAAMQELRRLPQIADITLRGIKVDRDKRSRAMPWAAKAQQGLFTMLHATWNRKFLDEVTAFPNGVHDDMVDSVSGALQMLSQKNLTWEIY